MKLREFLQYVITSPAGAKGTAVLDTYWTVGDGGERIKWHLPCAFCRCQDELREHAVPHGLKPEQVAGHCHNLEVMATGHRPNVENSRTKHCPC